METCYTFFGAPSPLWGNMLSISPVRVLGHPYVRRVFILFDFLMDLKPLQISVFETALLCLQRRDHASSLHLARLLTPQQASCLVNPRAGYETTLNLKPVPMNKRKRIAVVGSGPAGLAAATSCAERGHSVTLFERAANIGGQARSYEIVLCLRSIA